MIDLTPFNEAVATATNKANAAQQEVEMIEQLLTLARHRAIQRTREESDLRVQRNNVMLDNAMETHRASVLALFPFAHAVIRNANTGGQSWFILDHNDTALHNSIFCMKEREAWAHAADYCSMLVTQTSQKVSA